VWTAAEIMHQAGVPGLYPGAATVAAGLAYGAGEHRARDSEHKRLRGVEVAAVTGAVGAWVTAATIWGPLAGPSHLLSIAYLAAAGGGYWWLRRHEAVQDARTRRDDAAAWRERKATWHRLAPHLGLHGSHLLDYAGTLLGDTMLIDTRGTGKRASQISARDVAERLGEIEMIPAGRIDVTTDPIPGRLRISVRRQDPWARPLTHPAADPGSPYARRVEEVATCRKPLVIGADPETAQPLRLTLWDPSEGGKVILVAAKKGSGKTVLLSCITKRITACADAQLIQVNLGKHREDRRWAPLAAANALGREQAGRARRILAWVLNVIEERSKAGDDAGITPTEATPLLVVKIDEIDMVAADPVCRDLLSKIASKCRSEAVALVVAGQRATAQWVGGADLRANLDIAVLGRFARSGEARKATGEEIDLPSMGEYGEGHPGVFLVYELGGGWERGRVFNLSDPASIDRIVARRAASRGPYVPEPALAPLADLWAKITGAAPDGDEDQDDGTAAISPAVGGPMIQGTGQITAKIGQARALAPMTRHPSHPAGNGAARRATARQAATTSPPAELRGRHHPQPGRIRPAVAARGPRRHHLQPGRRDDRQIQAGRAPVPVRAARLRRRPAGRQRARGQVPPRRRRRRAAPGTVGRPTARRGQRRRSRSRTVTQPGRPDRLINVSPQRPSPSPDSLPETFTRRSRPSPTRLQPTPFRNCPSQRDRHER
jgi:hypothetical protein